MTQNLGWRYIFFASAVVAAIGLLLLRGTPESRAQTTGDHRLDVSGLLAFMIAMVALQVVVTQGNRLGWSSPASLALMAGTVFFGWLFVRIERRAPDRFMDFSLFGNSTYTGATLSNFLLNGAAGTLMVSLQLVQIGGGMTAQRAGVLTLGYAIAIVAFIRVGEKLLRRFGARRPMLWGCLVTGAAILLLSPANVMLGDYELIAVIGYTLFGVGLAFYATPSTDAALSNLPSRRGRRRRPKPGSSRRRAHFPARRSSTYTAPAPPSAGLAVAKASTCRAKRAVESQVLSASLRTGSWSFECSPRPCTTSTQRLPALREPRRNRSTSPFASSRVRPCRSTCPCTANSPRRSLRTRFGSMPATRPSKNSSPSERSKGASPETRALSWSTASRSGCQNVSGAPFGRGGAIVPRGSSIFSTPETAPAQSSSSVASRGGGGGTGTGGGSGRRGGGGAWASSRSLENASLKGLGFFATGRL